MRFLYVDWETYYDSKAGYTLSKMTAEEYVRDERFESIGFAWGFLPPGEWWVGLTVDQVVAVVRQNIKWFSGTHEEQRALLHSIDWSDVFMVGHNNSMFDSLIATERFGLRPAAYGCTLQLARCLNGSKTPDGKNISNALGALARMYNLPMEKGDEVIRADGKRRADFTPRELADYGWYCCKDTALAGMLWQKLSPQFPKSELFIAHLVTKMWAEPRLVLDTPLLEAMKDELATRKAQTLGKVADLLGVGGTMAQEERMFHTQKLLRSDAKFAELLARYDVEIPMKRSPKRRDAEGKALMVYAFSKTDEQMQALTEYEDGEDEETNLAVQALAAARLGSKSTIAESRVDRFLGISKRGALPVPYSYGATLTHRLSGCLIADTKIHCYDPDRGQCVKRIVDILPDDLVWDGTEYVQHGGVAFQGYREVIEHDGITGTPCHPVFIDENTAIPLAEAKSSGARIVAFSAPEDWLPHLDG